jgi:hypothetical protein
MPIQINTCLLMLHEISVPRHRKICGVCVPVTTAWHALRLQMEEWPPDLKGSCEYIE